MLIEHSDFDKRSWSLVLLTLLVLTNMNFANHSMYVPIFC